MPFFLWRRRAGACSSSLLGCAEGLVLPSYQIPPHCLLCVLSLSLSVSACLCHCDRFSLQSSGWPGTCTGWVPSLPPMFSDYISDTCFSCSSFLPGHTTESRKSRSKKTILCLKVCDLESDSLRAQRLGIWWCLSGLKQSREAYVTKE